MRAASPALIAFLNSSTQFLMADLYTVTLNNGQVLRYTDADIDIPYNGNVFQSFLISRSRTKLSVGLEVDTLDVEVNPRLVDLIGASPWLASARNGILDAANLTLEKAFMQSWGDTTMGALFLFAGRVSDIEVGRTAAKLTVKSELELLDTPLPRNYFQSSCLNTLFDNGCGLNKADYAVNGTVISASVTQVKSNLTQDNDYFTLGTLRFTSGANAGVTRTVRLYAGGGFSLALPLLSAPMPGDAFVASPGCDKLKSTCESVKFKNNVIHFRAYPFVPDPETAT